MTVNVDASRCIGCGMCAGGGAGRVSDPGAGVRGAGQPRTPAEEAGAFDAANGCPGQCHPGPEGMRKNRPPEHSSGRLFFIQSRFTRKSPRAAASARRCLSAARASSIPPMIWLDTRKPGRQVPAAVLLHRIAGPGALVQEGQKAGEPAAEAALKCLGVQTRRGPQAQHYPFGVPVQGWDAVALRQHGAWSRTPRI